MMEIPGIPLTIQDLVEISVPESDSCPVYPSRVEDISSGNLVLGWPTQRGTRVRFHLDQVLAVTFVRDGSAFHINALVTELSDETLPVIAVRPIGTTRRIQRREYYRVRTLVPVALRGSVAKPGAGPESGGEEISIVTHTFDISGAGLSVHQSFPVASGSLFQSSIWLTRGQKPIKLDTRVVHCGRVPGTGERGLYHIALEFCSISEAQRRIIMRHVCAVQRALLAG